MTSLFSATPTWDPKDSPALQHIKPTPLDPDAWERALQYHPDRARVKWAIHLLRFGVPLGLESDPILPDPSKRSPSQFANNTSAAQHADVVRAAIAKEVAAGRVVDYGEEMPSFPDGPTIVSPVGIAEKKQGTDQPSKFRFTNDLTRSGVNDRIPGKTASIVYISPADVARILLDLPPGYIGWVTDIEKAFRHVPLDPAEYRRVVFCFDGHFYGDTRLMFGIATGPSIYDQLGDLLQWIVEDRAQISIVRMLDDNFGLAPNQPAASRSLEIFYSTCAELGLPVQLDKTQLPNTLLRFIGFLWDIANRTVGLPDEKLQRLKYELGRLDGQTAVKRKDLESLTGLLNWAGFVVKHGRCFLRRFYDAIRDSAPRNRNNSTWIRLSVVMRQDLFWWAAVVSIAATTVSLDYVVGRSPPNVIMWSDAAPTLGYGAHWGHRYILDAWRVDIYGPNGLLGPLTTEEDIS